MPILKISAAVIILGYSLAAAQTSPSPDPAAAALRLAKHYSPQDAVQVMLQLAPADSGAAKVAKALTDATTRAALVARLTPIDSDGSLRAELASLVETAPAQAAVPSTYRRVTKVKLPAALANVNSLPQNFDGSRPDSGDADGFSGLGEFSTGGVWARLPSAAGDFHIASQFTKGPLKVNVDAEGLGARCGKKHCGDYTVDVNASVNLGPKFSLYVDDSMEKNTILDVNSQSLRGGVGWQVLDNAVHELKVTLGIGPVLEHLAGSGTDHFISPALSAAYTFHFEPLFHFPLDFASRIMGTSNLSDPRDHEFNAGMSFAYRLSGQLSGWSLGPRIDYNRRTEPAPHRPNHFWDVLLVAHHDF